MVDIIADPERAWQNAMRTYFQDVDYHGLGQIFRKWNVRGTENQNGTWVDWSQVPEKCQNDVKTYVQKVVETRRKQKEWEEFVRRETFEREAQIQNFRQTLDNEDNTNPNESTLTFEEREQIKNERSKKSFAKRVASSNMEEQNPSQWVLDRVPYPLMQNQVVQEQADDKVSMARWKKVGNLSHLILRDSNLRWIDEEYDENYSVKEKVWREKEEGWWRNDDGSIKQIKDEETSQIESLQRERLIKAHQWTRNKNKFSLNSQKTLRKFRDFIRQQGVRNNFLICPGSWAKTRNYILEDATLDNEDLNEDDMWNESVHEDTTIDDDDDNWDNDDEEEDKVNPWDRTNTDEPAKIPRVRKKKGEKTQTSKQTKPKKLEKIFESGTATTSMSVSQTPKRKRTKKN